MLGAFRYMACREGWGIYHEETVGVYAVQSATK